MSTDTAAMLAVATAARERAEAATPGPWAAVEQDLHSTGHCPDDWQRMTVTTAWSHPQLQGTMSIVQLCYGVCYEENPYVRIEPHNAQFIAAAITDVPLLAGYVEALVARVEALESERQVYVVAWAGYDEYTIVKLFPTEAQAAAFVAAQEYTTEHYVDEAGGHDWWNAACGGNWIRTCMDSEQEAQAEVDDHRANGSQHGEFVIAEETLAALGWTADGGGDE